MRLICAWLVLLIFLPWNSFGEGRPALLPAPQHVTWNNQIFPLSESLTLDIDPFFDKKFSDIIPRVLGNNQSHEVSSKKKKYTISVKRANAISNNPYSEEEAYSIRIDSKSVLISATSNHGVFNAIQTLRQLRKNRGTKSFLSGCEIEDWPAFHIRGFMHDTGRSYIEFDELKKEIELLSHYKINTFHWHLTENLAWRIQSKVIPSLTEASNMERHPGKFYTQPEAKELVKFCKERFVTLIPEIDMPGHSAAFVRATGFDMQSPEGKPLVKKLLAEMCDLFDVPTIHIGTDEVKIRDKDFVVEMAQLIRNHGKQPMGWIPGSDLGSDALYQMWTGKSKPAKGRKVVDSRYYYINHTDLFADLASIYDLAICDTVSGNAEHDGGIMCIWNDRISSSTKQLLQQNAFYPMMLTFAEKLWAGGGTLKSDWSVGNGFRNPEVFEKFKNFEARLLEHRRDNFSELPFPYVRQTNVSWKISDPFPNTGDLGKQFPPEKGWSDSFDYEGKKYGTRTASGAAIYFRHYWGNLPSFYSNPQKNSTAYAFTQVYSPKEQRVGMLIGFHNFGRSEKDATPPSGKWDYKESAIWLNDKLITPPEWKNPGTTPTSYEIPYSDENFELREPTPVSLNAGWNKLLVKVPVGEFSSKYSRLVKWMFTAVIVTPDGKEAVKDLVYSPDQKRKNSLTLARPFMDHMVLQRNKPIPVWGTAQANQLITVEIGTQKKSIKSAYDGTWKVILEPMVPGKVLTMKVSTQEDDPIIIDDIVVGDVWLCSGQSNMEFTLRQSAGGKEAVEASSHHEIRLFNLSGIVRPDNTAWDTTALGRLNKFEFFEGKWEKCSPETSSGFSAIGYYFGKEIAQQTAVPVGLIEVAVGGAPAEAFVDRSSLATNPKLAKTLGNWRKNELIMDWCRERAEKNLANATNPQQHHPFEPAYIFESAITKLAGFPIKGVIWYQGESNAHNAKLFENLFPALISSWRKAWNEPNLPFYFAQLSSIDRPEWPEFRDAQRKLAQKITACGMVVTSDLGDSLNVHPIRKQEIGHRFALQTLRKTYGQSVMADGPLPLKAVKSGKAEVEIIFNPNQKLHTTDTKPISELEAAGSDSAFYPIHGELKNNKILINTVGREINLVRYAWKPFSRGNLVNVSGLPASTFCLTVK